jgi:poly(3-hydroxybutyrate) depolymerase
MFYQLYEMNHAAMVPVRAAADAARLFFANPLNPLAETELGRTMAASLEVFERMTRRYGKPGFGCLRLLLTAGRSRLPKR